MRLSKTDPEGTKCMFCRSLNTEYYKRSLHETSVLFHRIVVVRVQQLIRQFLILRHVNFVFIEWMRWLILKLEFLIPRFRNNIKYWFDFSFQINQPTRCNSFTCLLLDVHMWLNMFRASPRPSSGAYNCTRSLWFYRWKEAAGAFLVVFWQVL